MNTIIKFRGPFWFLSNFSEALVLYDGIFYPTVEHAYQASKSTDKTYRLLISENDNPVFAKRLGKTCKLRTEWDEKFKLAVMKDLLIQKFKDKRMRILLMKTMGSKISHVNNHGDTFWGIYKGKGEDHLGRLLMEIREDIDEGKL